MAHETRFAHVNLVARDWRRLTRFYTDAFDCFPSGAKRDLSGDWLDEAVAVPGARIRGTHLGLPGFGSDGPTLEIFEYVPRVTADPPPANRPGFGHIAFFVDDVDEVRERVLAAGGSELGRTVRKYIPGAGPITFAYLRDPEGNVIEIQRWEPL